MELWHMKKVLQTMSLKGPNKLKPFACGSLGRSALRTRSGMAAPLLPEQLLHAERRLPWRYVSKKR
jgi:hypothetical protein